MPRAKQQTDEKLVAVRLTSEEIATLESAVKIGAAANVSDGIRLAIRYLPKALADRLLNEQIPALVAQVDALKKQLDKIPTAPAEPRAMGGYSLDNLIAMAAQKPGPVRDLAQEELLRRGYFPDGLGKWVESRPDLTRRVPSRSLHVPPTAGRAGKRTI